jgi:hypothetical protein
MLQPKLTAEAGSQNVTAEAVTADVTPRDAAVGMAGPSPTALMPEAKALMEEDSQYRSRQGLLRSSQWKRYCDRC